MNFFDRLAAALTPEASEEDRTRARSEAQELAQSDDWLARVLEQHEQIEALFDEALSASPGSDRRMAVKRLGQLLNAHAMAEEVVLYPALARSGEKTDATMAYEEQSMTKVEMAALEQLDPDSDEWVQQLEKIRRAVAHHVYEEESEWLPRLHRTVGESEAEMLSTRFDEEFDRHGDMAGSRMGGAAMGSAMGGGATGAQGFSASPSGLDQDGLTHTGMNDSTMNQGTMGQSGTGEARLTEDDVAQGRPGSGFTS